MRTSALAVLMIVLTENTFAASGASRGISVAQPGLLLLVGMGLVGLATLIRRLNS